MAQTTQAVTRRGEALSRKRIIDAAVELLDSQGEAGLTFRALAERLATGPGALYWHVDNKTDLLTAACDSLVARITDAPPHQRPPRDAIRALAASLFDTIDAHPWVGSALTRAPGQLPTVRLFEAIGRQLQILGVSDAALWTAASALLNYIFGVSGQNAANTHWARAHGLRRSSFLRTVSAAWGQLPSEQYPFVRSVATHLRTHDDRTDFLAGIDLILGGLSPSNAPTAVRGRTARNPATPTSPRAR